MPTRGSRAELPVAVAGPAGLDRSTTPCPSATTTAASAAGSMRAYAHARGDRAWPYRRPAHKAIKQLDDDELDMRPSLRLGIRDQACDLGTIPPPRATCAGRSPPASLGRAFANHISGGGGLTDRRVKRKLNSPDVGKRRRRCK